MIHWHAHALQRLSRRLSAIRGPRHQVPPSLLAETDITGTVYDEELAHYAPQEGLAWNTEWLNQQLW